MISGLLSQKPESPMPVAGQVKLFTWQNMTGKSGKPYVKIKNANAEQGGLPAAILKVSPTGYTDAHGNVSFNIEIEPQNGQATTSEEIRDKGLHGRTPISNGGLDERRRAIIRQHSQSMALELLKLKQTLGELTIVDLSPAKLRALADYFDDDVLHPGTKSHPPVDMDEPNSEPLPF